MGSKDALEGALPMFLTELNAQTAFVLRFNPQILDQLFQSVMANPTQISTLKFSGNSMFIDISTPDGVKVVKFNFTSEDKPCFLVQRHSDHWNTVGQIKGKFVSQSTELLAVPVVKNDHQVKRTEILVLESEERPREGHNLLELQKSTKIKANLIKQTPQKKTRPFLDSAPRSTTPSTLPDSYVTHVSPFSDSSSLSLSSSSCSEEESLNPFPECLDSILGRSDGCRELISPVTDAPKPEVKTEAHEGSVIELPPLLHPVVKFPKINDCNGFSESSPHLEKKPPLSLRNGKVSLDTVPSNQDRISALNTKLRNASTDGVVRANGFEETKNSDELAKLFDLKFSEVVIPSSDWPHSRSIHNYNDFRSCYDSFKRAWPYYIKMYDELIQSQSNFRTLLVMYDEAQCRSEGQSFRQQIEEFYNLQESKFLSLRNQYTLIHNEMTEIRKSLQDYSSKISKANSIQDCEGIE